MYLLIALTLTLNIADADASLRFFSCALQKVVQRVWDWPNENFEINYKDIQITDSVPSVLQGNVGHVLHGIWHNQRVVVKSMYKSDHEKELLAAQRIHALGLGPWARMSTDHKSIILAWVPGLNIKDILYQQDSRFLIHVENLLGSHFESLTQARAAYARALLESPGFESQLRNVAKLLNKKRLGITDFQFMLMPAENTGEKASINIIDSGGLYKHWIWTKSTWRKFASKMMDRYIQELKDLARLAPPKTLSKIFKGALEQGFQETKWGFGINYDIAVNTDVKLLAQNKFTNARTEFSGRVIRKFQAGFDAVDANGTVHTFNTNDVVFLKLMFKRPKT